MNESPLVTCLCLTMAGRKKFLTRAVECFRSQTYENRELLFVCDPGYGDDIAAVIPVLPGDSERLMMVSQFAGNVGAKRNHGCGWVRDGLIAIWDDDDFSAPNRLAQQVAELKATSKAVTGYRGMKFRVHCPTCRGTKFMTVEDSYHGGPWTMVCDNCPNPEWYRFDYPRGLVFGSSLLFTRDWWRKHPFPELQIGEDVQFVEAAARENQLSDVPDLNLMYASIHEGNTSPRRLDQAGWVKLEGFVWGKK